MKATMPQRRLIVDLMRRANCDTRTVTYMHRNLGVSDAWIGKPVDAWLDSLGRIDATKLISRLQTDDVE